jgi:L-serine kinase (ATP) / ParB family transcriptional regulator, heme-responsive regulator
MRNPWGIATICGSLFVHLAQTACGEWTDMSKSPETTESGVIPDLRIVPIESLVPHEQHDAQRSEPLVRRIREAGTWLNPPVVAPMDDQRFVILDGANRHFALSALGYAYILVQVVDYESAAVELGTWHHIVSGLSWFQLLRDISKIEGIEVDCTDLLSARAALARREGLAYAVLKDGQAYLLKSSAVTLKQRTAVLCKIVDTYKDCGVLNRISTDSLKAARQVYPDAVAIVVFPHYEPVEIIVAARDNALLPPGVSRHVVNGRAMRLNYPLEAFQENGETLEVKNQHLREWIQERVAEKRVRYYAEPMYLFDE